MAEIKIVLRHHIHGNNSIVAIDAIQEWDKALLCYTNALNCCKITGQFVGEWYFPSGIAIGTSAADENFFRDRDRSVVRLNRRNNATSPTGVFRCKIPDEIGNFQNIYVGIYPQSEGAPNIIKQPEYSYNQNQILTCTSTGGPVTTVKWSKNGQPLGSKYKQQKRIINQTTAEYQSVLILGTLTPREVVGNYTCQASNSRGTDYKSARLRGKSSSS